MAKVHVQLPDEVGLRIATIAQNEYGGNVAQYVRELILLDLLKRTMLSAMEFRLLKELK